MTSRRLQNNTAKFRYIRMQRCTKEPIVHPLLHVVRFTSTPKKKKKWPLVIRAMEYLFTIWPLQKKRKRRGIYPFSFSPKSKKKYHRTTKKKKNFAPEMYHQPALQNWLIHCVDVFVIIHKRLLASLPFSHYEVWFLEGHYIELALPINTYFKVHEWNMLNIHPHPEKNQSCDGRCSAKYTIALPVFIQGMEGPSQIEPLILAMNLHASLKCWFCFRCRFLGGLFFFFSLYICFALLLCGPLH